MLPLAVRVLPVLQEGSGALPISWPFCSYYCSVKPQGAELFSRHNFGNSLEAAGRRVLPTLQLVHFALLFSHLNGQPLTSSHDHVPGTQNHSVLEYRPATASLQELPGPLGRLDDPVMSPAVVTSAVRLSLGAFLYSSQNTPFPCPTIGG